MPAVPGGGANFPHLMRVNAQLRQAAAANLKAENGTRPKQIKKEKDCIIRKSFCLFYKGSDAQSLPVEGQLEVLKDYTGREAIGINHIYSLPTGSDISNPELKRIANLICEFEESKSNIRH